MLGSPLGGVVAGAVFTATGWLGVDQVTTSGPDLAGIALVITAVSGLIATVGALVIGLRKKPGSEATELALQVLAEQVKQMKQDET